jgi:hypothetical protein
MLARAFARRQGSTCLPASLSVRTPGMLRHAHALGRHDVHATQRSALSSRPMSQARLDAVGEARKFDLHCFRGALLASISDAFSTPSAHDSRARREALMIQSLPPRHLLVANGVSLLAPSRAASTSAAAPCASTRAVRNSGKTWSVRYGNEVGCSARDRPAPVVNADLLSRKIRGGSQ